MPSSVVEKGDQLQPTTSLSCESLEKASINYEDLIERSDTESTDTERNLHPKTQAMLDDWHKHFTKNESKSVELADRYKTMFIRAFSYTFSGEEPIAIFKNFKNLMQDGGFMRKKLEISSKEKKTEVEVGTKRYIISTFRNLLRYLDLEEHGIPDVLRKKASRYLDVWNKGTEPHKMDRQDDILDRDEERLVPTKSLKDYIFTSPARRATSLLGSNQLLEHAELLTAQECSQITCHLQARLLIENAQRFGIAKNITVSRIQQKENI